VALHGFLDEVTRYEPNNGVFRSEELPSQRV
jgi:hypothetical protein